MQVQSHVYCIYWKHFFLLIDINTNQVLTSTRLMKIQNQNEFISRKTCVNETNSILRKLKPLQRMTNFRNQEKKKLMNIKTIDC